MPALLGTVDRLDPTRIGLASDLSSSCRDKSFDLIIVAFD